MRFVRLIYASRMTEDCDLDAIQAILAVSRTKNKERDITGVLFYDSLMFMQCLEGPRSNVNEVYRSIIRDKRHRKVQLLEYCEATDRLFPDWAMGFLGASDGNREVLEKYTEASKFDPYRLTASQARDFLVEMAARKRDTLKT